MVEADGTYLNQDPVRYNLKGTNVDWRDFNHSSVRFKTCGTRWSPVKTRTVRKPWVICIKVTESHKRLWWLKLLEPLTTQSCHQDLVTLDILTLTDVYRPSSPQIDSKFDLIRGRWIPLDIMETIKRRGGFYGILSITLSKHVPRKIPGDFFLLSMN